MCGKQVQVQVQVTGGISLKSCGVQGMTMKIAVLVGGYTSEYVYQELVLTPYISVVLWTSSGEASQQKWSVLLWILYACTLIRQHRSPRGWNTNESG